MRNARSRIRYKRNPRPSPRRESGYKVRDERCGFYTYEGRLRRDGYGLRVDPRFGTYDPLHDREGGQRP